MWSNFVLLIAATTEVFRAFAEDSEECRDLDAKCANWVTASSRSCNMPHINANCRKSCGLCGEFDKKYDLRRLPSQLKPLAFLVGKWRSDHGGKAVFATIPTFTYGEEVDISIPDSGNRPLPALNFTSRAWSVNNPEEELHSESGYISVDPRTGTAALTTTMNNGHQIGTSIFSVRTFTKLLLCGFVTAEEGLVKGTKIKFRLIDVGRMSFSHDLPVVDMVREWALVNKNALDARLSMRTLTHRMQPHTTIRYNKIEP